MDTVGTGARAQVARDIWSIPRELGHGPELPGTDGGAPRPSELGRSLRDSWSNPRAIRPERESPGRAVRHLGTLESSPSRPGKLVDPA